MSENSSYFELQIKINPDIEDILSDICFENLPCEGVVLAEETYKDLEMIATTEGTLRVFLTGDGLEPDALKLQVETLLTEQRELLKSRGLSEEELASIEIEKEPEEANAEAKDVSDGSDEIDSDKKLYETSKVISRKRENPTLAMLRKFDPKKFDLSK